MIPKNTKKIVLYLLRNLELVNINQISKILKISVGSAFKILKNLEKEGLMLSKTLGNAKFYQINLNNEETIKICELLLMEERRNLKSYSKLYAQELRNFKNSELILLFGSILNNSDFNDVDVLFLSDKPKEISNFCLEVAKLRTKPIVPLILKKQDLIKEINNKNEAVLNILKTGIILKGESVFLEIIKNAKN
jgi:hypothetical protein